jgi:hypothetical protein
MGSMQWNVKLVTNSAFALGLRKTTENLDRVRRSQDLPDANWLLASSSALNPRTVTLVLICAVVFFFCFFLEQGSPIILSGISCSPLYSPGTDHTEKKSITAISPLMRATKPLPSKGCFSGPQSCCFQQIYHNIFSFKIVWRIIKWKLFYHWKPTPIM